MGIRTVAVYSEADKDARHVELADEAVPIGPPPSAQSYLVIDGSSRPARTPAPRPCIPGYGFLSENAAFCARAGEGRHRLHRPEGPRDRRRWATRSPRRSSRWRRRSARSPATTSAIADAERGGRDRQRHRLSGDDQGLRRRRRQGPARRVRRRRVPRGLRLLPQRGEERVRRRPGVHREVHRGAAPHRDPGAGRRPRQHRVPEGARVLDPAPPPEGDRGGAVAVPRRRDAQRDGRAGGALATRRAVPVGRHGRVRRRPATSRSTSSR